MRKKGLALVLAALMVWGLALPAWAQANPFTDLSKDHWAFESVILLAAAGLVEGYPDGTFGGDRMFTRYEMAMVFARILARFEQLIDEKIAQGIEVRTGDLVELIRQTRQELAAAIQANSAELSAALGELSDRLGSVESSVGALDGRIAALEANAGASGAADGDLAARVGALEGEVDALAAGLSGLHGEVDALAGSVSGLEGKVDTLAADVSGLEGEVGALAGDVDALAGRTGALEADVVGLRAGVGALEGDVDALETRVGSVESGVGALDGRVAGLESDVDSLAADLAALQAALAAGAGTGLAPEAAAALSEAAINELTARLREMATKADVQELADRIAGAHSRIDGVDGRVSRVEQALADLQSGTLTEEGARAIADLAIADALAARDAEVRAALAAAQGDTEGLAELIRSRIAELSSQIERMSNEFRHELELLGVRVADLEERMRRQEAATAELSAQVAANTADIDELKSRKPVVTFGGTFDTEFVETHVEGDGPYYKDPRDEDGAKWESESRFDSSLALGVAATPAENVEVKAEIVVNDLFGSDKDGLTPSLNLDVTTGGVLRSLHVGDLEGAEIAASFDKYTFVAGKVDDVYGGVPFQGASVELVFGNEDSTTLNGFLSRKGDNDNTFGDLVFGAAAAYDLSDEFSFVFRGVKDVNSEPGSEHSDAVFEAAVSGTIAGAEYSVTGAHNVDEDPATAIDAWTEFGTWFGFVRAQYASVGDTFNPSFGKDLDSGSEDWLDRKLSPPADWVEAGESDGAVTFGASLLGIDAALTLGRRTDPVNSNDNNTYQQAEIGPFHFAGVATSLLYDRRTNDDSELDNTVRATFETTVGGAAVAATLHNRKNEQVAAINPDEVDQRSAWVTASHQVNLVLPIRLDLRYGVNQALGENSTKVGVSTERDFGGLVLRAGYSTEQNAVGKVDEDVSKSWWKNENWLESDAQREIATFGAGYTLRGIFGTDINTGYEFRLVREDGAVLGTARNTFTASFEKELRGGEAVLAGEGKYVTGGIPDEDGNEADLVAKVTLTYPVFEGASIKLGGEVVNSVGAKQNEFRAVNVNAGLTVEF